MIAWLIPVLAAASRRRPRALGGEKMKMRYGVHRFDLSMTRDQAKLEQYLNSLEGEVIAIIPNVTPIPATFVDFLLIVERVS